MNFMEEKMQETVDRCRAKGMQITVTPVGNRPCSADVDAEKMAETAKKNGRKCIGCPDSESCSGNCSGCCSCKYKTE